MDPSHFLFHPLGRTCLRLEECPIFTFPPSHSSSPHMLSTNRLLPDFASLAHVTPPFLIFNGAVQTVLSEL